LCFADAIDTVLVPEVNDTFKPIRGWNGRNEVEDVAAILLKSHVVIKFVVGADKVSDAVGYRVLGNCAEVSDPVRVY
jgi:hypothetical protein